MKIFFGNTNGTAVHGRNIAEIRKNGLARAAKAFGVKADDPRLNAKVTWMASDPMDPDNKFVGNVSVELVDPLEDVRDAARKIIDFVKAKLP